MGLIISSEKEMKWIESERKRQRFYMFLVGATFILMTYAFFVFVLPENRLSHLYRVTFYYSFIAFMVTVLILLKSRRYLEVIDTLLEERRH